MGRAIAQAGLAGKIVAIGFDGNGVLQNFVKDGTIQAICVQSSYNMGYLGVKTAFDALHRQEESRRLRGHRLPPRDQGQHRHPARSEERSLLKEGTLCAQPPS
jgi:ABC-type sugar transport system substrate-binding protein